MYFRYIGHGDNAKSALLYSRVNKLGHTGTIDKNDINHFIQCRDKSLLVRIIGFFKSGIYRQSAFESIAIFIAIVLRRF